ncbi:Uncharacterised protein [Legionella pneumophila]|nr:Uncharacterised protein [Legionella pneumophila]
MAVRSANFPERNPPIPNETKKIPIMVLTLFLSASTVIADNPTGESSNSAKEIIR